MNCLYAALLASLAVPASAASVLTGITVGASGARLAVEGPVSYKAFKLDSPDRFVVDLQDAVLGSADRSWRGAGPVKGVRAALFGAEAPVLRVVFDLEAPLPAATREAPGAVLVEFGAPAPAPAPPVDAPEAEDRGAPDFKDALAPLASPVPAPLALRAPPPGRAALAAIEAAPDRAVLTLDRAVEPVIFLVTDPPRLVVDLPGASSAWLRPAPAPPGGPLKAVRAAPRDGGARVVLDLERPVTYSLKRDGGVLSLELDRASAPRVPSARTREFKGWVVDGSGRPLDGVFLVRFSLPDQGGLSDERWAESLYVDARGGRFAAVLGRTRPLPSDALSAGSPVDAAPPPGTSWRVVPR